MDDSRAALTPGTVFHERYRIVRPIKTGGMGEVYEVLDLRTNSPRALKVMLAAVLDSPGQRERFEQEAQVTGRIDSEHIVRISDAGVDGNQPYLVMELLRGEELQAILDRARVLPPGEALLYLGQLARALEKTHAQGIIHRDLKPENLFVSRRDDGSPCVKILDFGIAKIAAAADAKKTRSVGTPLFMAPEQVLGDGAIQPSADLYALAHVAYCLLAGEPYWVEESEAYETIVPMLKKVLSGPTEPASERALRRRGVRLAPGFDAWFARAAAVSAGHRFMGAVEQIDALRQILLAPVVGGVSPAAASMQMQMPARSNAPSAVPTYAPISEAPVSTARTAEAPVAALATAPTNATLTSAAPKRSRAPLVAGIVGGALAVAGIGGGVFLAVTSKSSSAADGASASAQASTTAPTAPRSSSVVMLDPPPVAPQNWAITTCPGAKCAELKVTSYTAAPIDDLHTQALDFMAAYEPTAKLYTFMVTYPSADATLDLTAMDKSANWVFIVGNSNISVAAVRNLLIATRAPAGGSIPTIDSARPCPFKSALAHALAKSPIADVAQVAYMPSPLTKKPIWMFIGIVDVDAETCAVIPPP